jgi:hypothetical protein
MLLFKYPLQKRKFDAFFAAVQDQEADLTADQQKERAMELLVEAGVSEDLSSLVCEEYSDQEIKQDYELVDFERASELIESAEAAQEAKRQEDLEQAAELER